MSRWATWAPVVSAVAVVGLVVGVSLTLGGGSDGPPALRLAAGSTTDSTTGPASASSGAASGYRLTGTLPTGPDSAQVRDLPGGAAPVNRVRELARALGIEASPERVVKAWRAGALVVRDDPGHPWTFGAGSDCGPDSAVSSDGTTTCVAPHPGSGSGSSGSGGGSVGTGCAQPEPAGASPDAPADCPPPTPVPADQPQDTPATVTSGRATLPSLSCPAPPPGAEPAPCDDTPAFEPCGPSPCPTDSTTVCPAGSTFCAGSGGSVTCPAGPAGTRCASAGDGTTVPADCGPAATCAVPPVSTIDCGGAVGKGSCTNALAMTVRKALDATQRLRTALGLVDADVTAYPSVGGATVVADPRVDGRRTQGLATTLTVDADKALVSAAGWLADSRAGASYPLISATEALERLAPPPALGAPCDAKGGCPEPAVTTLSSVELGLQLTALQDSEAALVPAWLFAASGGGVLTVLAVQDAYVTEPTDQPADQPGTVEPAPGKTEPGQTEPAPGRSPLAFDGAVLVDGRLSVRYGSVCVTGAKAEVKEAADSVTVVLTQDTPPPDQACIDLYQATFVEVALAAPLGDRTVVDASTGREVTVVTCPSTTEMCPG
ncbi:MAG: hypothetical protein Q8R60_14240 [Mycobacteriales bacterium]|nr:hypothetical protein [Mycobacteriales bacterium]